MAMNDVTSSNIAQIGYKPASDELLVRFKNGRAYLYQGVPISVHRDLMNAASHGNYFNSWIRGKYPTSELAADEQDTVAASFIDGADNTATFVDLTWKVRPGVTPCALFA